MRSSLVYIGLALVIGIILGSVFSNQSQENAPPAVASMPGTVAIDTNQSFPPTLSSDLASDDLRELNQILQNEIDARMVLEQKLAEISKKVTELEDDSSSLAAPVRANSVEDTDESLLPGPGQRWFDEQALIASGMSSSQARELKINFEQWELERLYLRDQSIREGWDRDRYREALQALTSREDELKNQLSETEYDSYLYASGQTNRVAVTSVLESAPAASAGIEPGDHIIRYDNQRIYNWRELRDATSSGAIGDMVAVEVDRDGRTLEFYLARGPLGIRMNSVSISP